jgi:hypothetical protein
MPPSVVGTFGTGPLGPDSPREPAASLRITADNLCSTGLLVLEEYEQHELSSTTAEATQGGVTQLCMFFVEQTRGFMAGGTLHHSMASTGVAWGSFPVGPTSRGMRWGWVSRTLSAVMAEQWDSSCTLSTVMAEQWVTLSSGALSYAPSRLLTVEGAALVGVNPENTSTLAPGVNPGKGTSTRVGAIT